MDYEHEYEWRYAPGPDECEDLEEYQIGGLHPVTIGDQFCDGRYTIVHKLGAGAEATVWLAKKIDGTSSRYAALKIMSAEASDENCNELRIHKHLQQQGVNVHKLSHVAVLQDSFWIEGPNGKHFCMIFDVAGPSLTLLRRHQWKIRPDVARSLALQTAQGLQELHAAGVVYGDLSTNNLLLRLVDIDKLTVEQLYEQYGQPVPCKVQTVNGDPIDSHAPEFAYEAIRFCDADLDRLKPEMVFVDLADGRLLSEEPESEASGWSFGYTAPETLWFSEMQDEASDVWALACIFFELRSAKQLFPEGSGPEDVQDDIVKTIEPMPSAWAQRIAAQVEADEDEEDGQPQDNVTTAIRHKPTKYRAAILHSIKSSLCNASKWLTSLFRAPETSSDLKSSSTEDVADTPGHSDGLHIKVEQIGTRKKWFSLSLDERIAKKVAFYGEEKGVKMTLADVDDEPPPAALSDEENVDFKALLFSMLRWGRADRLTLSRVVSHAWLRKDYGEASTQPWLKQYTDGFDAQRYGMVDGAIVKIAGMDTD